MDSTLSASKLKTLQKCSWLFWCNYGPWNLPQKSNDGARRGTCVHKLYECLLNPRHKKHYKEIVEKKSIKGLPVVEKFVRKQMQKEGIAADHDTKGNHNFNLIDRMILVGLLYDFYCETGKLEKAETAFSYANKDIGYTIRGIVDKISKHGNELMIHDYKTSAKRFEGDDLKTNVQAMIYSLYAKRVRKMDAIVRFVFLRFPEQPHQELKFNDKVLEGFEQYLAYISDYLKEFTIENAKSNLAAYQSYPKKGEGFKGPALCGYGKYPGHVNKEGEVYWVCPFKWSFDYYALINKSGKVVQTAFEEKELGIKEDHIIEKRYYAGCPAWQPTKM